MSSRDFKVAYSSRESDVGSRSVRERPRREYNVDRRYDDYRDYRDSRELVSTRSERSSNADFAGRTTKTTYGVARDRNAEAYVTRGDVVVLDHPRDRVESMSDSSWEVIRPERSDTGTYVVETGGRDYDRGTRQYEYEYDDRRRGPPVREIEVLSPPRRRERSRSRGLVEAMHEVQVTVDSSDDDRRSALGRRGRRSQASVVTASVADSRPSLQRRPSAFKRDHSPGSETRLRSRSVGFYREDIDDHDATERRHERPGAEAHVAGRYLVDHRGESGRVLEDRADRRSRGYPTSMPMHRTRNDDDDYEDNQQFVPRRGEEDFEDYEYRDYERKAPYPPQRGVEERPPRHRRRHHRHHRDRQDDETESKYSEYYDRKKTTYL